MYPASIQRILEWKDPDILVSLVTNDDIELPLFIVEFSTAVFTEDHELQRFDGMVAAAENNVIFIKISPISKTSEFGHGGNTDFDYKIPFALIYKKYGVIPFHINWKSRGSVVEVHKDYLSCPKDSTDFEKVIELIFNSFNFEERRIDFVSLRENTQKLYGWWLDALETTSFDILFNRLSTSRINLVNGQGVVEIKINRFGHAMDPERGMLVFYSTLFSGNAVSKMVFYSENDAWYKDIPKESEIRNFIQENKLQYAEDFLYIFYLGSGLCNSLDFGDLKKSIVKRNKTSIKLELTELITSNWNKLSKPLKTIFKFSKEFYIEDDSGQKRVIFNWNKDFNFVINRYYSEKSQTLLGRITEIDEDIVSYITIHNILRPQGYEILAASYPGAQGDRVILTAKESGRRQPRRYIDIIAFSLNRNISTLQLNKGLFLLESINEDIEELKKYKSDKNYGKGLREFFCRFKPEAVNSIVKIGVGFWLNKNYSSDILKKMYIDDLDYFLCITRDMKRWFLCRIGNVNILNNYEGDINIPILWKPIDKKMRSAQKRLM